MGKRLVNMTLARESLDGPRLHTQIVQSESFLATISKATRYRYPRTWESTSLLGRLGPAEDGCIGFAITRSCEVSLTSADKGEAV